MVTPSKFALIPFNVHGSYFKGALTCSFPARYYQLELCLYSFVQNNPSLCYTGLFCRSTVYLLPETSCFNRHTNGERSPSKQQLNLLKYAGCSSKSQRYLYFSLFALHFCMFHCNLQSKCWGFADKSVSHADYGRLWKSATNQSNHSTRFVTDFTWPH